MKLRATTLRRLISRAREARKAAYAPYSGFQVGAALLAADGRVFPGVNVENSAYPICQCAERSALGAAVTAKARRFKAIAIICKKAGDGRFGAPCGGCRQALSEFGLDLLVILAAPTGQDYQALPLSELLPQAFTPASL